MQDNSYLMNLRDAKRSEILASISTNGLCASAKDVRLRSNDKISFAKLAVNLVDFTTARSWKDANKTRAIKANAKDIQETCELLTYGPEQGAWSISVERYNAGAFDYYEAVERLAQSIYIVFSLPSEVRFTRAQTNAVGLRGDSASHKFMYDDRFYSSEAHIDGVIPNKNILAIIAPKALVAEVRRLFQFVEHIISVDNVEHSCPMAPAKQDIEFFKTTGPDYVAGLQEFLKLVPIIEKFGLHAVRLPTEMDMVTGYADVASREGILAHYRADSLEKALRNAAHKGCVADVNYLIKLGAQVDAKDTEEHQRCALHWAILKKRLPVIVALLSHNADRTVVDAQGRNCEFYARSRGLDLTELLAKSKSFVTERVGKMSEQPKIDDETGAKIMGSLLDPELLDEMRKSIYETTTSLVSSLLQKSLPAALKNVVDQPRVGIKYADCFWLILEKNGDVDIAAMTSATSTNDFLNLKPMQQPNSQNVFETSTAARECLRKILASDQNTDGLLQGHIMNVYVPKENFLALAKIPDRKVPKLTNMYTYTRESLAETSHQRGARY